jgi:Leucine-rich repeat (LRR) protein
MRIAFLLLAASVAFAANDWIAALDGHAGLATDGSVRSLSFRQGWVSDSDMDLVARLDKLEVLDLSNTRVTDLGLLKLKDLKNIRVLNLFYAELITDEGLATMRNWAKIERINARGTKVTDNTLALLAGKTTIAALDIGYAEVTDSGLQHLSTLPNLRELAIGGNKLTEVGLQVLRTLPQLRVLDLAGKQRTDSGLWFLGTTDLGLDPIATVGELRDLNLSGLTVTGRGLAKLKPLAKLERLDLHACKRVGDDAVPALAALAGLQWVDVSDTAMTAAGADQLRNLRPALRLQGAPAGK